KIEPGYFKTMGIPLLAGRDFAPQDTAAALKVAIVSEGIRREYFPGGPAQALGRRVRVNVLDRGEWLTVVGVVADIRQMSLEREVQPMIYAPFQQDHSGFLRFVAFVARTSTPGSVVEGIRAEIRRAAPDLPIQSTVTMDEAVAASVAQPRFRMVLLGLFAMTATLIATCGLYGLMAYAVTQRRREIGVRMALGATRRDVLRLVLARALRIVVAGLLVGLAGAAGVTRVLQRFLFGVTPTDPIAFTLVTLLLMAVGLMAAWLPARRATRIDPCAALRAEEPPAARWESAPTASMMVLRDLSFAWRARRRSPAFAIAAVATTALGIGASTAIFSVANAVLLRPLPYDHPDRLVVVYMDLRNRNNLGMPLSTENFFDIRDGSKESFEDMAAFRTVRQVLPGAEGSPEQIRLALVTTNFFRLLGHRVVLGRDFQDADGMPQPLSSTPQFGVVSAALPA